MINASRRRAQLAQTLHEGLNPDALFDQGVRPGGPSLPLEGRLSEAGEQHEPGVRMLAAQLRQSGDPVHHRHRDVEQHQVGARSSGDLDRLGAVLRATDDLEITVHLEQEAGELPDTVRVIGHDYPNGQSQLLSRLRTHTLSFSPAPPKSPGHIGWFGRAKKV
jgi:hypothetical protein